MKIGAYSSWMEGGCGITILSDFEEQRKEKYGWSHKEVVEPPNIPAARSAGAGWQIAAFVNNDICEEAYKTLLKTRTVVFQSPVRKNKNSGNLFFFCVYSKRAKDVEAVKGAWPFKESDEKVN